MKKKNTNSKTEYFLPNSETPGLKAFDLLKAVHTALDIMKDQIEEVSQENLKSQEQLIMSTVVMHSVLCTIIKKYTVFDPPSLFEATNLVYLEDKSKIFDIIKMNKENNEEYTH